MTIMFKEPLMLLVNFQNQTLTNIENIYDSLMRGEIKRFFIMCNILQTYFQL